MQLHVRAAAAALLLVSSSALGAAWPTEKGELIVTETTLADFYSYYARNSGNSLPLEEVRGSVVQAGNVYRLGFLLGAEYGITERFSATLNLAFFYTQHLNVGANLRIFTNSQPNTQVGLQDLTGNLKSTLIQTGGKVLFALAPFVGWAVPVSNYDTSVDNPLGDGIISIEPGLAVSLMVPAARFFVNAEIIYKVREDKAARVGALYPATIKNTVPDFPDALIGGQIHDQIQATFEAGVFITDWFSIRGVVRRIESLGGSDLTFEGMPELAMRGIPRQSMFDNSLAYDQDALYVGGGPYVQVNQYFGIGATYIQAIWFRNFPNMKTVVLSLSFNPQFASRAKAEELKQLEQLEADQAAADAAADATADAAADDQAPPVSQPSKP